MPIAEHSSAQLNLRGELASVLGDKVQKYQVTIEEHVTALRDEHLLAAMVLVQTHGLIETLARTVLSNTSAPLPSGILTHAHPTVDSLLRQQLECWGPRVLTATGKAWPDVDRAVLVEAAAARNAVAHCLGKVDQTMLNRIEAAGGKSPWSDGEVLTLTFERLETYRGGYKTFARLISGGS